MRHVPLFIALAIAAATLAGSLRASEGHLCFGADSERRIPACTELIETPGIAPDQLSTAYAMRALSYSLRGDYESAVNDYDRAIEIIPNYPVALNNRAWAYYKWGKSAQALPDVERSLQLDPTSPHALDTRAHVRQYYGEVEGALRDYMGAMRFGGPRMIRLYQCGLQGHGLYDGKVDGIYTPALRVALEQCVERKSCDPLPPDEECRAATS